MKLKKGLIIAIAVLLVVAFAVPGVSAQAKKLKFAYVCKMLTHPWFIEEENGIKAQVKALGLDYIGVDAVKKILFEGASIGKELSEKEYYLRMLYYD